MDPVQIGNFICNTFGQKQWLSQSQRLASAIQIAEGPNSRTILWPGDLKTIREASWTKQQPATIRSWDVEPVALYIEGLGDDLTVLTDTVVSDTTCYLTLLHTGCRCMDVSKIAWTAPIQRDPDAALLDDAYRIELVALLTKEELLKKESGR